MNSSQSESSSVALSAITFDKVAEVLRLNDDYRVWQKNFSKSEYVVESIFRWMTSEGEPWRDGQRLGFPKESAGAVRQGIEAFRRCPEALRLLTHLHWLLFESENQSRIGSDMLPMLPARLGKLRDMFYVVVFLSGLPKALEIHQSRGLAESDSVHTLSDLSRHLRGYHERTGRWGLDSVVWLTSHFQGRLIALHRLQFQFGSYDGAFQVFEHVEEKRSLALALAGLRFREDGQFADADNETAAPASSWQSVLVKESDQVTGHPACAETGAVSRKPVTLDLRDWKPALAQGDAVLVVHIPAGEPLDLAECRAAINECIPFFGRHYPEQAPFRALTCNSWLLDPQISHHLEHSNIARFQSLFQPLPVRRANDSQMLERVFGNCRKAPEELPADTSLQRTLIAGMKEGVRWRRGAGYILRSQLPLESPGARVEPIK